MFTKRIGYWSQSLCGNDLLQKRTSLTSLQQYEVGSVLRRTKISLHAKEMLSLLYGSISVGFTLVYLRGEETPHLRMLRILRTRVILLARRMPRESSPTS